MGSLRVVVAGYAPIYRAGLCAVLPTDDPGRRIAVVGEAGELERAVALVRLLRPAVVVTDLNFPGDPSSPLAQLRAASPESRVLVLADRQDPAVADAALDGGAAGYMLRPAKIDELIYALEAIVAGTPLLDPRLKSVPRRRLESTGAPLSEREREVLKLLALGYTNAEVASRLVISVRTVETHRSNIQRKLGVRTRAELAHIVFEEPVTADVLASEPTSA